MTLLKDESVKIMNEFDIKNRSAVMNHLTHRFSIPEFDADDILQDAWLLLLDKLTVGDLPHVPEKLLAYMLRVCTLKAHEYLRKREYQHEMTSLDDSSLTPERRSAIEHEVNDSLLFIEERDRAEQRKIAIMEREVDKLTPRQKALLHGYYFDDESMRDLAGRLGYSSEKVAKSTKCRLIKQLHSMCIGNQQQEEAPSNGLSPVARLLGSQIISHYHECESKEIDAIPFLWILNFLITLTHSYAPDTVDRVCFRQYS